MINSCLFCICEYSLEHGTLVIIIVYGHTWYVRGILSCNHREDRTNGAECFITVDPETHASENGTNVPYKVVHNGSTIKDERNQNIIYFAMF